MGSGASIPEQLDLPTVQKLAGARFNQAQFDALAVNGKISRAAFLEAERTATGLLPPVMFATSGSSPGFSAPAASVAIQQKERELAERERALARRERQLAEAEKLANAEMKKARKAPSKPLGHVNSQASFSDMTGMRDEVGFHRIRIEHPAETMKDGHRIRTKEEELACEKLREARGLRRKWFASFTQNGAVGTKFKMVDGIMRVYESESASEELYPAHSFEDFAEDYKKLVGIINNGPCKTFCNERLRILETKFEFHKMLNGEIEHQAGGDDGCDFY